MANTIKPFVSYADFEMSDISEIRGDVRITKVEVDYFQHFCDGVRVSKIEYVKVIAYPTEGGTKIAFFKSGKTEEGGFSRYETIEQNGDEWELESGTYGRDCDGSYESHYDGVSDGEPNPNYENQNFPSLHDASVIAKKKESFRDFAAEAMGY